ncbi:MAG: ECF-type sigma factor [Phycisphaerales bacterium]|nr:ECF-type sigma factor [Phycisphaerales bacterium]
MPVSAANNRTSARGVAGRVHQVTADLLPALYDELRRQAADFLQLERPDHTLQPTALVHEAYLRLLGQESAGWQNQEQFLMVTAKLMRRILVDHARARRCRKRGGGKEKTPLDQAVCSFEESALDLVALEEALTRLESIDARKSRVVELRFFCGLNMQDTSKMLKVPLRTVERDWTMAKAWLRGELGRS